MGKTKFLALQDWGRESWWEMKAKKPEENSVQVTYLLTTLFRTHQSHKRMRKQLASSKHKDTMILRHWELGLWDSQGVLFLLMVFFLLFVSKIACKNGYNNPLPIPQVPLHMDAGLSHATCSRQQDIGKCEPSRDMGTAEPWPTILGHQPSSDPQLIPEPQEPSEYQLRQF